MVSHVSKRALVLISKVVLYSLDLAELVSKFNGKLLPINFRIVSFLRYFEI